MVSIQEQTQKGFKYQNSDNIHILRSIIAEIEKKSLTCTGNRAFQQAEFSECCGPKRNPRSKSFIKQRYMLTLVEAIKVNKIFYVCPIGRRDPRVSIIAMYRRKLSTQELRNNFPYQLSLSLNFPHHQDYTLHKGISIA